MLIAVAVCCCMTSCAATALIATALLAAGAAQGTTNAGSARPHTPVVSIEQKNFAPRLTRRKPMQDVMRKLRRLRDDTARYDPDSRIQAAKDALPAWFNDDGTWNAQAALPDVALALASLSQQDAEEYGQEAEMDVTQEEQDAESAYAPPVSGQNPTARR